MSASVRTLGVVAVATAVWLASTRSACALGFRNPDQDARATGQGEAFVAQADDAAAIYYNPSGLTQVKGTQITVGSYLDFPSIHFDAAGGGSVEPADQTFLLPHVYVASDLGLENWRFGLGVNVPFGNSIDWGNSGPFQYYLTQSSLSIYNVAPTVAYQFNEHLSVGASMNVYIGNTSLERNLSPLMGGGHFKYDGDGEALGATLGLLWKINDQNSVGIVYRSPFAVGFDGTASLKGNGFGLDSHSAASANIRFPQSVAVGYALRPVRGLKLEFDIDWTNWETLNKVVLNSHNPLFNAKTNPTQAITPFNWKDSFFYEVGAQLDLADHWAVRAGYIFSENTVPSSAFSPVLPDSNRHVFSAGLGFAADWLNLDAVYQYSLSTDRTITGVGNPFAGEWSSSGHAIMLTSTFRF